MEEKNELEKRFTSYLMKTIKGYSNREKIKYANQKKKENELTEIEEKETSLKKYLDESINELNEIDVNYTCPEKAFSNPQYYKAMKKVPLKQKEALYLLVVDELSIEKVADILNTTPNNVKKLKSNAIKNFKRNLEEMK